MRALGFCVSVDHARFMARALPAPGIPPTAVWGTAPRTSGGRPCSTWPPARCKVVFSVDLFNEGVDVPASTPC